MRRVGPRPGRTWRWLRHIGIVACFTALYLAAFEGVLVLSLLGMAAWEDLDRPEFCAGLPEDGNAAAYAFAERVYARFPHGTDWREVATPLRDWGFVPVMPRAGRLNPGGRYVTEIFGREIWCEVRWTSDASGGVTSVRPLYMVVPLRD